MNNQSTALVLSGGGAKGAFHVGALQVLREAGYTYDAISGISVGTLNGVMLATGQFHQLVGEWKEITPDKIYKEHSLFNIARRYLAYKIGIGKPPVSKYENEPLHKLMIKHLLGKSISLPFHFGFVKLETGVYVNAIIRQADHKINHDDIKRVLASTAIPVVFNPVEIGNFMCVDGGLRNISPIKEILPYNPDRVIIIPTEPIDAEPKFEEAKDIINIAFKSINIMLDEIFNEDIDRFLTINGLVQQAQKQDAKLVKSNSIPYKYIKPIIIAPKKTLGSALNFDNARINEMITLGRKRAEEVLDEKDVIV